MSTGYVPILERHDAGCRSHGCRAERSGRIFDHQFAAGTIGASKPSAHANAHYQVTTNSKLFVTLAITAAWKSKPSYGVVAGADRTLNPDLQRFMYKRAKATITDVPGASHSVYILHPDRVAAVIEQAAER